MKILSKRLGIYLIFMTCLTYSVAYISRLSYSANITAIAGEFPYTKDELGLVSSFLFFAYGGGQILNFFIAKYYNPKYVVTLSFIMTAFCNLMICFTQSLIAMEILWLINGIFQSLIWCNICNVQAKYLTGANIKRCVMWGGFAYCFGTCAIYALSALFINFNWRVSFYIAVGLSLFIAVLWFFSLRCFERAEKVPEPEFEDLQVKESVSLFKNKYFCYCMIFVAIIAIFNSFIKDGLITWFPTILKETFGMAESFATLVVMGIALLSTGGIFLVKVVSSFVKGNVKLKGIAFGIIAILVGIGMIAFSARIAVLFTIAFVIAICLVFGTGNIITSKIPFGVRKYGNVGGISSFLDAFCYVGSTIATYIFGVIAERSGWFIVLVVIAVVSLVACALAFISNVIKDKNPISKEIF